MSGFDFSFLSRREVLPFPEGDNRTDTILGGNHFNLTTLNEWNYTLYSNGTVSNGSRCYLLFEPYVEPLGLWPNGSWHNSTSCWVAINPVGPRALTGIGFAVAFGVGLVLTMTALAKHGRLYLPVDRRFYPIGRRWQWYWACFVCSFALISLFMNIDVDRYFMQEIPMIVTVFAWFLINNGIVAVVWEAVRHWGSWQERQFTDPNPYTFAQDDRRAKVEFYLPLWFYFWNWMNFFLCIPRSWVFLRYQSAPDQIENRFNPGAVNNRFKAGAFCLVVCWLTICFSMHHSIHYYKPSNGGFFRKILDYLRSFPPRFLLIVPLCAGQIAYQVFISFVVDWSLMRHDGPVPIIFGWGYGPALAIIYIQIFYGYFSPNEDKELLRQRIERGEIIDRELGLVRRPAWWSRVRGDHLLSLRDKIGRNVNEIGTERGAGRRKDLETAAERAIREDARTAAANNDIELAALPNNPRVDRAGVKNIYTKMQQARVPMNDDYLDPDAGPTVYFPNLYAAQQVDRHMWLMEDGPASMSSSSAPPPYTDRRSSSSTNGSLNGQKPQQVRSMLDV
ncbi:hypothetical protein B0I35DRAFT_346342 [Stachybotrys elegans]|uniref:Uncharacterized protein n=1 Tax=Stachybotrys elegans TaxID=80388 RepID=A0A8K0WVN5_9HYPO|nr:hypothetical protein B0I35DRAFT_346342 [Stachybotrys elegans]